MASSSSVAASVALPLLSLCTGETATANNLIVQQFFLGIVQQIFASHLHLNLLLVLDKSSQYFKLHPYKILGY
jgi:hypothetical protein